MIVGGYRLPSSGDQEIRSMAMHLKFKTDRGYGLQQVFCNLDLFEKLPRLEYPLSELLLLLFISLGKGFRVFFEILHHPYDFNPFLCILYSFDIYRESESIQKLRSDFAFLRVHRSHQDELGGVRNRDALPFYSIHPHGGGIEQNIYQVIVQQIDLVYIQDALVDFSQDSRLQGLYPLSQCLAYIQAPRHPVFSGSQRQLYYLYLPSHRGESLPTHVAVIAGTALNGWIVGATVKRAPYHLYLR